MRFPMSFFTLPLPFGVFFSLPRCLLSPTSFSEYHALRLSGSCPRHGDQLLREPLPRCGRRVGHAHCLRVHASCRLGGALPKRRGNAGSDSELPYHQNSFLEVRWICVFASSHSRCLSPRLSTTVPPRACTHVTFLLPPPRRLRLRPTLPLCLLLVFFVPLSSSSSSRPLLPLVFFFFVVVFFFVSACSPLADPCWLKPLWLQAQLLGGVHVGSRTKDLSSDIALC